MMKVQTLGRKSFSNGSGNPIKPRCSLVISAILSDTKKTSFNDQVVVIASASVL